MKVQQPADLLLVFGVILGFQGDQAFQQFAAAIIADPVFYTGDRPSALAR